MFFFLLCFQKQWYLQCLVHLWLKSIGIHSIFCVFALLPQKTLKRKNAVIYSTAFVSKRHPQNGGECSRRRLWATRIPSKKLSPSRVRDFLVFSGPGVGGLAAWGAPHHRALVALGRSWHICQRSCVEPAEPNLRQPGAGQAILEPCWQRLRAYGVGRLVRNSPLKPRKGYVEPRQVSDVRETL